jgi:hypothetical protein
MEKPSSNRSIHPWAALCTTALLAGLLLATLCLLATSSGAQGSPATDAAVVDALTPITYSTTINPGQPMVMGNTDVILEFAQGASGMVTVTLVSTAPVPSPPGGTISLTWDMTTTVISYEVTATFIYSRAARDADIVLVLDDSGSMEYENAVLRLLGAAGGQWLHRGRRLHLPLAVGPEPNIPARRAGPL